MNDPLNNNNFDDFSPAISFAVQAVLAEPVPDDSVERVKSRAMLLGATTIFPRNRQSQKQVLWPSWNRYGGIAAAIAAIAALAMFMLLDGRTSMQAFSQVIQNVNEAQSVQLTMTSRLGRSREQTIEMYIKGNCARTELFDGKVIQLADLDKKRRLSLDTRNKVAIAVDIDEQTYKQLANPIDQLRSVKPIDAEYIGEERLDGRLAQVYRIDKVALWGMSGTGQMIVWVDPKDGLPVKIEIHDPDRKAETKIRLEDFVWNAPLDDSLFALNIPEGYKVETILNKPTVSSVPDPPKSPDPQFAKGVLSSDRVASRITWNQPGTTLTAIMRDPESVALQDRKFNELRQWDSASGKLNWSVTIGGSISLATALDGTMLATVAGGELQLRDPSTGKVTRTWSSEKMLLPLAFSPDGKTLAAGIAEWGQQPSGEGQEGGVQLWNVRSGTLKKSLTDDKPTTFVRYSSDGKHLASAPNGGPVKVWDAVTGELVRIFPYGGKFDFSPDGRLIACMASKPLSGDTQDDVRRRYDVQIYELHTSKLIKTLTSDNHTKKSYVLWVEFSPNGKLLTVANWDGTAKLWNVDTGELVKTITEHDAGVLTAVFTPDGKRIATGGEDRLLRLWNVDQLLSQ